MKRDALLPDSVSVARRPILGQDHRKQTITLSNYTNHKIYDALWDIEFNYTVSSLGVLALLWHRTLQVLVEVNAML